MNKYYTKLFNTTMNVLEKEMKKVDGTMKTLGNMN